MVIEVVDMSDGEDKGADRETRVRLCPKHPWCTRPVGHDGDCDVLTRTPQPKPDYGPKRKASS